MASVGENFASTGKAGARGPTRDHAQLVQRHAQGAGVVLGGWQDAHHRVDYQQVEGVLLEVEQVADRDDGGHFR